MKTKPFTGMALVTLVLLSGCVNLKPQIGPKIKLTTPTESKQTALTDCSVQTFVQNSSAFSCVAVLIVYNPDGTIHSVVPGMCTTPAILAIQGVTQIGVSASAGAAAGSISR